MKRKLTRANIDELRREMPILTETEMKCCNGGNSEAVSWDCLFNCMNAMDPSRSAEDYAREYQEIYGLDPSTMGGVPNQQISNVLWVMGFENTETNSMINNRDYVQIVTLVNADGTAHAVIAKSLPNENGDFIYYDPTTKNPVVWDNKSNIAGIYRIKKSDIDTSVSDTYGENNGYDYTDTSISSYDYNNYSYNDDNYNKDSQDNYTYYNC